MKKQTAGSRYQPSTQKNKENFNVNNPCTAVFIFDNFGAQTLLEKLNSNTIYYNHCVHFPSPIKLG